MSADVKAACVERLLREQLNIHLGEELFNLSVKWCAGDILKAGTMVKYANAVGVNGVLQLLRG